MNVAPFSRRAPPAAAREAGIVEFDLHGLLGIRLLDPSPGDVARVAAAIGLPPAVLPFEPAITIRFVQNLPVAGPLNHLGREDVGFTDDDFFLLRTRNLARARTRIDFGSLGERTELVCESGLPAVPLLRPLINLAMLARGIVPVHAAAFEHRGRGVMVTGWSHGAKTGTLLSFMAAGARFVGDEWIYLAGGRMHGLPDHLEARPWYLRELPAYGRHLRLRDRVRMGIAAGLARILGPWVSASARKGGLPAKLVRTLHQALLDQQSVDLEPIALFGREACPLQSNLDVVIVGLSRGAPKVAVEAAPVEQVAKQMAASFRFEQDSLHCAYRKHLFAFPERRNPLLDHCERIYRDQAVGALAVATTYRMLHPYPVSIRALRQAVEPLLDQRD